MRKINTYEKNGYSFLIFIVSAWLFMPKINIIDVGGFEQGVRIQDFLFLIGLFFILNKKNIFGLSDVVMGGNRTFYLISYMLLSSCLPIFILENNTSILLFTFRWLEYFIFGAMVFAIVEKSMSIIIKISKYFILVNFAHAIIYFFMSGFSERFQGFTSGPWEISTMLILLYLGIYPCLSVKDKILYFLMIIAVIILAKARMQLLAIVVIFFVDRNLRRLILNPVSFILFSSLLVFNLDDVLISLRFEKFRYDDIVNLMEISKTIDENFDYHGVTSNNADIDASVLGRFVIWIGFINKWLDAGLYGFIFGIAPGAGGVNVDGFYVRLITEFGFIGIVLVFYLIKYFHARIDLNEKTWLVVALMVICISLDPFTSQKIFAALCISLSILMKMTTLKKSIPS